MVIINLSNSIGAGVWGFNSITGSFFVSLLVIFILLLVISLMFRIPLEYVGVVLLPLAIVFAVGSSGFFGVLIIILIFLGVVLAKNFFFNN